MPPKAMKTPPRLALSTGLTSPPLSLRLLCGLSLCRREAAT